MIDLAAPAAGLLGSLGLYQLIGESTVLTKKGNPDPGNHPFATAFFVRRCSAKHCGWPELVDHVVSLAVLLLYLVFTAENDCLRPE